jgi:uncharacterized delta-60 repeat protein
MILLHSPITYSQPGELDINFGDGGKVVAPNSGFYDESKAIAVQQDGKILVAGRINDLFGVMRFNENGGMDSTFGVKGIITTTFLVNNIKTDAYARTIIILPDSNFLIGGYALFSEYPFGTQPAIVIFKFKLDGSLDSSFGNNGRVFTKFRSGNTLALQADGKIVAGGTVILYDPTVINSPSDFSLVRYKNDGSIDSSFGTNGMVNTQFGGYNHGILSLVIQPDNKIIAAGSTYDESFLHHKYALARYETSGALDLSFGKDGKLTTDFAPVYNSDDNIAVALQEDGKIVIACPDSSIDFALARFNTNGVPDSGFGTNGIVFTDFAGGRDAAYALNIQQDNKIIAAGSVQVSNNNYFGMIRYNQVGQPDYSFGINGKVFTDISGQTCQANAGIIQPDGKILLAGFAYNSNNLQSFALARYQSGLTPSVRNTRSGKWSDASSWNFFKVPAAGDDVELLYDIIVDKNGVCNSLKIRSGKQLILNSGILLTVKKN